MLISNEMTIGKLAAATRCTIPTIRYYEEIGLLPKANRRMSKHRIYGPTDLRRLTLIRRSRDFGFSIKQIRELVALVGSPERDCTAARDLAAMHLIEVGRKLKELRALERSLKEFVENCSAQCAGGPMRECIILEDLTTLQPSCCEAPKASAKDCCGPAASRHT
ncbi:MAG: helix-turn-helix domain-containing protein [Nitrospiraceae bacterium]|nr:helix-turn-helix domain-containing protein [Nitrospiraceae bacterium]